jgi:hypothetical protein
MTDIPKERLSHFLGLLESRCDYAVVKNPDLWENLRRGGDWDLVVSDPRGAQRALVEALGHPRRVARRSYVVCYFFDWGEIDLLPSIEWHGLQLIDKERFFARAVHNTGGWRTASPAHEAITGWIGPLLASGAFSEKYEDVVREAVAMDSTELELVLKRLFGRKLGSAVWSLARHDRVSESRALTDAMRKAVRYRAFTRRPVRTCSGVLRFLYYEVKLRLEPALPFLEVSRSEDTAAASQWRLMRDASVPGFAVFQGVEIRKWTSEGATAGAAEVLPTSRNRAGAKSARFGLRKRIALSNLQARGWLVASTVATGGVRTSWSTLIGKPMSRDIAAQPLGDLLDGFLAFRTAEEIKRGA